jgi:AraC-like DNA-binding protein
MLSMRDSGHPGNPDGLSAPVRKVMEFIGSHYAEPLQVGDLSTRVPISGDRIRKLVRKETGISIGQHINRLRVEKAKRLLLEKPDAKISAIWKEAGFGSESQFLRVFRRYAGRTPNVFRKSSE